MNELLTYITKGLLAEKISTIKNNVNGHWPILLGTGSRYLEKDKSIIADKRKGFTSSGAGSFIVTYITVNVQNYKNYFVPSFSLGPRITLTNRDRSFKWEPGLLWEPHFIFAKDAQDKLRTYRNDFLTIIYAQGGTRDHDPRKDFSFSAALSLGYLVYRQGDYMENNTFRFCAGKIILFKSIIEPSIYFNNFFKEVTPCIRMSQSF